MAKIFEIQEVTAISRLAVTASWSGTSARSENANAVYNPPPGWVILETETIIHSSNNGGRSVSTLAGGLNLVSKEILDAVYDSAIDFAYKQGDTDLEGKLKEKQEQHINHIIQYQTTHNTILAKVSASAHGSPFDRKRGWEDISVKAKLIYLGQNNIDDVAAAIEEEYAIDIPNMGSGE